MASAPGLKIGREVRIEGLQKVADVPFLKQKNGKDSLSRPRYRNGALSLLRARAA